MNIRCNTCTYARKNLGQIASECYAVKHSIKARHPVSLYHADGSLFKIVVEDRTIPLDLDDAPF